MGRFEVSVVPEYVPSWTCQDGLRELVQNARDEQDRTPEHAMRVHYTSRKPGRLTITSEGVTLPRTMLLLGKTTKVGAGLRGQWGEGLDLGLVALLRAGLSVRIENGPETWTPALEWSDGWQDTVLVVHTRALQQPRTYFRVEIDGILPLDWSEFQRRTRFVPGGDLGRTVAVGEDVILLDRPGELYARGLWVGTFTGMKRGYDLHDVELDRDRRVAEEWRLRSAIAGVWMRAMADATLRSSAEPWLFELLHDEARDIQGFAERLRWEWDSNVAVVRQAVAEGFAARHGQGAVAVSSTAQAIEAKGVGLEPVVVASTLREAVEAAVGVASVRIASARQAQVIVLAPGLLGELGLLDRWAYVKAVAGAIGIEGDVVVARFGDPLTLGRRRVEGNHTTILLSETTLRTPTPCGALATLAQMASPDPSSAASWLMKVLDHVRVRWPEVLGVAVEQGAVWALAGDLANPVAYELGSA